MTSALRVGTTKHRLLGFLGRYHRATAEQCTRYGWSPNSIKYVRQNLNELVASKHLQAYQGFSRGSRPAPMVYVPSMQGWRYAERHHGLPIPHRWRDAEAVRTDYGDFLHDLALTDFGIALETFVREADPFARLIRFVHDRLLPQRSVSLPSGGKQYFRPDGFFELHITRSETGRTKQRCHLLEIDRGTHYEPRLKAKLQAQLSYVESGGYVADYGTRSVSYLWVCPEGHDRAHQVRKLAEAMLRERKAERAAALFAFTDVNPATIDPVALFITRCWQAPFQTDPVALLRPAPDLALRDGASQYLPQDQYDRFLATAGDGVPVLTVERDLE